MEKIEKKAHGRIQEKSCQIFIGVRKQSGPESLSPLTKISLNLLKQEKTLEGWYRN